MKYVLYWCLTAGSWCGQIPLVPDLTFEECNSLLAELIERAPPGLHVKGECREKLKALPNVSIEPTGESNNGHL